MRSVLLVSHGSRSSKTKEEVTALAQTLKERGNIPIVEYAFLEIEVPNIPQGISLCIAKGATEVLVLLNFLNSGRHVNDDIPEIIRHAAEKNPQVSISMTPPVGQHSKIADLFLDLIKNA